MPADMPETPGLEVFGTSLACLEVAGDYFDVIKLDEDRTVLTVADVAGKGAGAAMLMSNLQASIRTAVRVGSDLELMIGQINDLIFDNTQSHQFITFFAGIYDRSSSRFEYVNAGHTPPLLASKDGTLTTLDYGGLILGAMPGVAYEKESLPLEAGDLLVLYTDGLSEAQDSGGDMYEDERIREFILRNLDLRPADLARALTADVERFMGGTKRTDDLTLLIARVGE